MEVVIERHERITVPLKLVREEIIQLVWEEVGSLGQILPKSPSASYDVLRGRKWSPPRDALISGSLQWTLDPGFSEGLRPRQHLVYMVDMPSDELRFEGTIELAALGDGETEVGYRVRLESCHRLANLLRGVFHEIATGHAQGLVLRTKARVEQRSGGPRRAPRPSAPPETCLRSGPRSWVRRAGNCGG